MKFWLKEKAVAHFLEDDGIIVKHSKLWFVECSYYSADADLACWYLAVLLDYTGVFMDLNQ